jgi:hypothetical protein
VSECVYAARVALLFSAKMTGRLEQRCFIKFFQKLGNSQVETSEDLAGFWPQYHGYHTLRSGRIQPIQRWPHVGGERRSFRWALSKPK